MRVFAGRRLWKSDLEQLCRRLGVPHCFCGKPSRTTGSRTFRRRSDFGRELDFLISGVLPHKLDGVRTWGVSLLGLRPGWAPSRHPSGLDDGDFDSNLFPIPMTKR